MYFLPWLLQKASHCVCFRRSTGSEPIRLCRPFALGFAVIPGFGEPSPRATSHRLISPSASRGHQASRGMGWSLEGTLSTWWKWRLSLLSGGTGGGLSGGGEEGSLKGGGGAGSGLSCFLTMQGEDWRNTKRKKEKVFQLGTEMPSRRVYYCFCFLSHTELY